MGVGTDASYVNVSTAEMLFSRTMASTGACSYDLHRIRPDRSTGTPGRTYDEVHYVAEADQAVAWA